MDKIERVEVALGHRHRAVEGLAALLERSEGDDLAGQVNPVGGQLQRLGDPAAGLGERGAQRAHLTTFERGGGGEEPVVLGVVEVLALAFGGEQFSTKLFTHFVVMSSRVDLHVQELIRP